ncbi:hypothetical protein V2J09_010493 [Rumex salicifolius]
MESEKKQLGSSSSSSLANDLFNSKDSSSSNSVFGSIFDSSSKEAGGKKRDNLHDPLSGRAENPSDYKSSLDSIFEKEGKQQQPFHYSSSIYYGGQDNYSDPQTTKSSSSTSMKSDHQYKKDGEQDDPHTASRGNWWQGLYQRQNKSKLVQTTNTGKLKEETSHKTSTLSTSNGIDKDDPTIANCLFFPGKPKIT